MGYLGGIGGGCTRDLLLSEFPAPLHGPAYPAVCVLMSLLALTIYRYSQSWEERFRTKFIAYLKSFTLPWFAILGAHKALDHNLGIFAAIIVGVIATTAGGVDRRLLRGHAGNPGASGATRYGGGVGEHGLHTARSMGEGAHLLLSGYPESGAGFFSIPGVCC